MSQPPYYLAPGALHIHTIFSHDCSTTVPKIAAAARDAGLSWIIVTDHDNMDARAFEGWHDGVLVIAGHEITPRYNHLLAFNTDAVINHRQHPQDFFYELYHQQGFGIIAHPDDHMVNKVKKRSYEWQDWSIDGPRERNGQSVGLELWNLLADWGTQLTPSNKYVNFLFPQRAMRGPTAKSLRWWDKLNMEGKRTFGVAGVDAHALKRRILGFLTLEVFSYRRSFEMLTNYLLLKEPLSSDEKEAKQQVYAALKQGQLYFINRLVGGSQPVVFGASRNSDVWWIGDSPSLAEGPIKVFANTHRNASLRLIHNGNVICRAKRGLAECVQEPGVYRLEADDKRGYPMLFTNPIYVQP